MGLVLLLGRRAVRRRESQPAVTAKAEKVPDTEIVNAYKAGEDKFRAASRWLIGAFAAIAGLVLAGASLVDLRDLPRSSAEDGVRGLGVAIAGTVLAVLGGLWILLPFEESIRTFRKKRLFFFDRIGLKRIREDPTILGHRYENIDCFLTDYQRAREAYLRAVSANANPDKLTLLDHRLDVLDALAVRTAAKAHYERFKRRFQISILLTMAGVLGVAVGINIFARAAYIRGDSFPSAVLTLSAEGQARLGKVLGEDCVKSAIAVVVVSGSLPDADIVVPAGVCNHARFRVTSALGTLVLQP